MNPTPNQADQIKANTIPRTFTGEIPAVNPFRPATSY